MGRTGIEPVTLRLRVWCGSCGWLRLVGVSRAEAAVSCLRLIRRFAAGHGWCVAHPLPHLGLLAQPGGFEGLGPVGEAVDSDNQTVSEGEEGRKLALDFDALPPLK